jgi:peptide/nickel transport system permease protein
MARFLIVRLSLIVVTLLAVSIAIFTLIELVPGDAAQVMLGQQATPDNLRNLRKQMGLDRPPHVRYLDWIGGAVTGDLGESAKSRASISGLLGGRLANSALLAGLAFLIAVPLGLALGVWVGTKVDTKIDRFLTMGGLVTISLPEFVTGVVMILIFSSTLQWLPSSSIMLPGETIIGNPQVLIMPILTVTGALFAYILRMARANVIEVMGSNYVRTAILKGLPMRTVVIRHVLPNAMLPTITVIANNVGWLFGGLIIVENLFAYPGMGSLLITSINTQDIRMLQSTAMVIAAVYAFSNLAADLTYGWLNPRVRLA